MFGEHSVPKVFKGDKFYVTIDGKVANIDLSALVSLNKHLAIWFGLFLFIYYRR